MCSFNAEQVSFVCCVKIKFQSIILIIIMLRNYNPCVWAYKTCHCQLSMKLDIICIIFLSITSLPSSYIHSKHKGLHSEVITV